MQEAGVAAVLHCLVEDVYCIVWVGVFVIGGGGERGKGEEEEVEIRGKKKGGRFQG